MINKCGCLYVDREKFIECFNELWEDGLSKLIQICLIKKRFERLQHCCRWGLIYTR